MSTRISKFLSLVLRHEPHRFGITLDGAGWTDVGSLLEACAAHGVVITRDQLAHVVASSDKQRFALSADGAKIRANQGHSVEVELGLAPAVPPALLYHGTVDRFVASIRTQGLVKGSRHHVHLSADVETAQKVGSRRGKPVILTVRARELADAGHVFYRSANGVWLVDHVPPQYLDGMPVNRSAGGGNRSMKVTIAKTSLAACEAGHYTNRRGERVELAAMLAAAKAGTVMHETPMTSAARTADRATRLAVTSESTIDALIRLAPHGGHLACLSFASAKNPGGGFLGGAQAQEETLARSSGLYPCLCAVPAFYEANRQTRTPLYAHRALFSPRVPFFRNDDGDWLDAPLLASVITCAAPNASAMRQQQRFDAAAVEQALRERAALVLAVACEHGVDRLVLGAWGAGVFGNDPAVVASAWQTLLAGPFAGAFEEVVFAVLGDRETSANYRAFADAFVPRARS